MSWNTSGFQNTTPQTAPSKPQLDINAEEASYYQMLYQQLDPNNSGSINGKDAITFFKRSGIDVTTLKKIWIMSSSDSTSLNQKDFFSAMRLIAYAQNGIEVSEQSLQLNIPVALPQINGIALPPARNNISELHSPKQSSQIQVTPPQRNSLNQGTQDLSQYDITQEQYNKFETFYFTQDTQNKGNVQGGAARELFFKSQLSNEELKLIWKFCDTDTKGFLMKGEFIAALHLIASCKKGLPLPQQIPESVQAVIRGQRPDQNQQFQQNQNPHPQTQSLISAPVQYNQQNKFNHDEDSTHQNQGNQRSTSQLNSPKHAPVNIQSDAHYQQLQTQQLDLQKKATDIMLNHRNNTSNEILQQCVQEKKKEIEFLDKFIASFVQIQTQLKKEENDLHQQLKQLEDQKQNKQNQVIQLDFQMRDQLQINQKMRQQVITSSLMEPHHQEQSTQNTSQSSVRPMSQGQVDQGQFGQTYYTNTQNQSTNFGSLTVKGGQPSSGQQQGSAMNVSPNQFNNQNLQSDMNMEEDFSDYQARKQRIASNNQLPTSQQTQVSQLINQAPLQSQPPQKEALPPW